MCGRTALRATPEDLREALGLEKLPDLAPHYNVPPSCPIAVLRARIDAGPHGPSRRRTLDLMRWGLVPAWAKKGKPPSHLALARVESVLTSGAFRDAVRKRRCLVVVDGFYEWRREGGPRRSQPFFVRRADGSPFTLAAVWDRWCSSDGEVIESCAIVTQPSRPPVDSIHDRMPLVIEPDCWDRWLDPGPAKADALAPLLVPCNPALIAYPVGVHVNDPRHDDAACVVPEEPAQLSLA